jgi:hypothetical protein
MADPKSPADPKPSEPEPDERETAFWEKLDNRLGAALDAKLKGIVSQPAPPAPAADPAAPGTSRTGGKRVTLHGLIADFVFGPEKD